MSFDYDPYRHIELVRAVNDDTLWRWHCHSCGGGWNSQPEPLCRADRLYRYFQAHLISSHERTPEDFAGWTDGT
jgi:hypothetical protein